MHEAGSSMVAMPDSDSRTALDERTLSSDDALKALPPKISPILQEGLVERKGNPPQLF
jgi:hypothetical protein